MLSSQARIQPEVNMPLCGTPSRPPRRADLWCFRRQIPHRRRLLQPFPGIKCRAAVPARRSAEDREPGGRVTEVLEA